jgi:predicted Fe-Mo cluster-binding NifX family protein
MAPTFRNDMEKQYLQSQLPTLALNLLIVEGYQPPRVNRFATKGSENDLVLRIAVPLLNNRVAPYFGSCDELLLLDQEGGALRRTRQLLSADDPGQLGRHIAGMGVQKIVCGGIWTFHKDWLMAHGIEVIENQCGSVEEVVSWLQG